MRILVTGVSSGLGLGLAECHLDAGHEVLGLSRRSPPPAVLGAGLRFLSLDLTRFDAVETGLRELLGGLQSLDLVYLNAGVLGTIQDLGETRMEECHRVLDLNVWANKAILDGFTALGVEVAQVVGISSGVSKGGVRGLGAYSISKAALDMLLQLYAREWPATHFTSLAPGMVDTAMQEVIAGHPREDRFPGLARIRSCRGTPDMPSAHEAARRILAILPELRRLPSGSWADLRQLSTPG